MQLSEDEWGMLEAIFWGRYFSRPGMTTEDSNSALSSLRRQVFVEKTEIWEDKSWKVTHGGKKALKEHLCVNVIAPARPFYLSSTQPTNENDPSWIIDVVKSRIVKNKGGSNYYVQVWASLDSKEGYGWEIRMGSHKKSICPSKGWIVGHRPSLEEAQAEGWDRLMEMSSK